MGDLSELRGLITVVSFLGVLSILFALIPSQFYTAAQGRQINLPDEFDAIDIQSFADSENFTIDFDGGIDYVRDFVLGGWNIYFRVFNVDETIVTAHYASFWIVRWSYHFADWYDAASAINYGSVLTYTELNSVWDGESDIIVFNAKTDQTQWRVYFWWNLTDYDTPSDALNNDAMGVVYLIGFDQINTTVNAWTLVSMLLFFQMPDVHPAINAIIAIPLWACVAYLVYVLILKAIPFV